MSDVPVNSIVCGDCHGVVGSWPDSCVDLVITSPPYDFLREYDGYPELNVKDVAQKLYRVVADGEVVVWVVGDSTVDGSETCSSFKQAMAFVDAGWYLHDTMIYEKTSFAFPSTASRYHQTFEYMFIFSKGKPRTFNPIKDRLNIYRRGGGDCKRQKDGSMKRGNRGGVLLDKYGMRGNVWRYKIGGGHTTSDPIARKHPAAFPERLAMDHINSWSNPGDVVVDIMCGSGTVCACAVRLNRKYVGVEISQEYCDIATKRVGHEIKSKAGRIF